MYKKLIAEAIGTFALCFIGILAIGGAQLGGAPAGIANLASIGLAHGLTIAFMIAALGAVSGAHFNPAVTFGFVVARKLPLTTGAAYWAAQLVGATAAGGLLSAPFGESLVAGGTPALGSGITPAAGAV